MTNKRYVYLAAGLMLLCGCAGQEEQTSTPGQQPQQAEAQTAVIRFDSYSSRQQDTRAGYVGDITDTELRTNGFGVFAFHTGTANYGSQQKKYPNFMYNERIYWDATFAADHAGSWRYDTLKPWPNGKTGDDESYGDKVSFFAYAPYVDATKSLGNSGIIALSSNANAGDPTVTYRLADDGQMVDLLWGTCQPDRDYHLASGSTQRGAIYNGGLYPVNINLQRQTTGEKVHFLFKHALAKIGGGPEYVSTDEGTKELKSGLLVQLDIDSNGETTGGKKESYQIVTIRDISIKCSQEASSSGYGSGSTTYTTIKNRGTLNLATGQWSGLTTDGTAPSPTSVITSSASSAATLAASTAKIRPELAEPASFTSWDDLMAKISNSGVQTEPMNVYDAEAAAAPMVFLPGSQPVLEVTVDYIVRVRDTKLLGGYSEVKQKITKTVAFTRPLELNKKYSLTIHIGLNNIKFSATVDDWAKNLSDTDINGDGKVDDTDIISEDIHLPINVK